MNYRQLGNTELNVSEIGFGSWGIGGYPFWNHEGDKKSVRAIEKAVDLGINFFDTAPVYGFGHSEELLGKTLKPVRDRVIIATKCGLIWNKRKVSAITKNCTKKSILKEIDQSLSRLKTDIIDLYQVHWPDTNTPQEETMDALLELQHVGKIKYFGVSNYSLEQLNECLALVRFESLQTQYNLLERSIENDIMPFCKKHNISVLAYSPLASGVLTGKYDKQTRFTDWRSRGILGHFSGKEYETNIDKVERLKEIASRLKDNATRTAIKWSLSTPSIASILVGVKNESQLKQNLEGIDHKLDTRTIDNLNRIFI